MKRTIIIGDVHGCLDELCELLREVRACGRDELISVGDLICKGPDSRGVLDWAMETKNLRCVQGNHELRHLSYWRSGGVAEEKPYDMDTFRQLSGRFECYMRFIAGWPLTISRKDLFVVHAGFDSRLRPVARQLPFQLTNLRRLPDTGRPWYEQYGELRLAVFGHWAHREPVLRDNCVGLDTGCVYGGSLSALILPERRVVSVRARKVYRRKALWS